MPYNADARKTLLLAGVKRYYNAEDFEALKGDIATSNISTVEGRRDIVSKLAAFVKKGKLGRDLFSMGVRVPDDVVLIDSSDGEFQRYLNSFTAACEWRSTAEAKDVVAGRNVVAAAQGPAQGQRATEEKTTAEQGSQDAVKRVEETRLKLINYDKYMVREDFESALRLTWT
jgi:hypothetical protein